MPQMEMPQMEISIPPMERWELLEISVPISKPTRFNPKRFNLMTPVKLVSSGKKPDASDSRKKMKQAERNYAQSDAMVLDFDEIVPEERTGVDDDIDQRRAKFYAFHLRCLGHHGRVQWQEHKLKDYCKVVGAEA